MTAEAIKISNLPSDVQIGALRLKIRTIKDPATKLNTVVKTEEPITEENSESPRVYGCLSYLDQTIYLQEDQAPDMMADTLLHEMIHGIWAVVGGWAYEIEEERVVAMITGTLLDTLRRNKEVTKFLLELP